MPVKKLPAKLVKRLRAFVSKFGGNRPPSERVNRWLGRRKNVDHRREAPSLAEVSRTNVRHPGRRVRQVDVSRNFPGTEPVIKRVEQRDAKYVLDFVRGFVSRHNKEIRPSRYRLAMPKGYEIGRHFIAMSKTNAPAVSEILRPAGKGGTERGKRFLLEKLKGDRKSLTRAWAEMSENLKSLNIDFLDTAPDNYLVLGVQKGRIVFMPLFDMH